MVPDYALLNIEADRSFRSLPSASVASSTPALGSTVYFINYESGDNSVMSRYPNPLLANYFEGDNVGHAAEYAGTVIARSAEIAIVATGLQGYGPKHNRQVNSQPAASGGGVFEGSGKLYGLTIDIGDSSQSAGSIADQYHVILPTDSRHKISLSYVQPITPALLAHTEAEMATKPACN